MSAAATKWAMEEAPDDLSTAAMCTLLVMAGIATSEYDYQVWFERPELARRAHVHGTTLRRAMADLSAAGLIQRVTGMDRCARARRAHHRVAVWRLTYESLSERTALKDESLSERTALINAETPLIPLEETRPSSVRDLAQRVAGSWWERTFPRPMLTGGFPAARAIVEAALRAGWTEQQVARALPKVKGTLVKWKLADALEEVRAREKPAADGFDQSPPEGGRRW